MIEGVLFAYVHGSFIHPVEFRDIDVAIFWEGREEPFNEEVIKEIGRKRVKGSGLAK